MFDWDDLRIFLAVARSRHLASAARSLGMDATTGGAAVAAARGGASVGIVRDGGGRAAADRAGAGVARACRDRSRARRSMRLGVVGGRIDSGERACPAERCGGGRDLGAGASPARVPQAPSRYPARPGYRVRLPQPVEARGGYRGDDGAAAPWAADRGEARRLSAAALCGGAATSRRTAQSARSRN